MILVDGQWYNVDLPSMRAGRNEYNGVLYSTYEYNTLWDDGSPETSNGQPWQTTDRYLGFTNLPFTSFFDKGAMTIAPNPGGIPFLQGGPPASPAAYQFLAMTGSGDAFITTDPALLSGQSLISPPVYGPPAAPNLTADQPQQEPSILDAAEPATSPYAEARRVQEDLDSTPYDRRPSARNARRTEADRLDLQGPAAVPYDAISSVIQMLARAGEVNAFDNRVYQVHVQHLPGQEDTARAVIQTYQVYVSDYHKTEGELMVVPAYLVHNGEQVEEQRMLYPHPQVFDQPIMSAGRPGHSQYLNQAPLEVHLPIPDGCLVPPGTTPPATPDAQEATP